MRRAQLRRLYPHLVVLAYGTNESGDHTTIRQYESELRVVEAAARRAAVGGEIVGRAHAARDHALAEARRVFLDLVHDSLAELIALFICPVLAIDLGGYVLHEDRHKVLARRRHRRICQRRYQDVEVGIFRPAAVLPVIVSQFQAFDGIYNVRLGDTTLTAISPMPAACAIFTHLNR